MCFMCSLSELSKWLAGGEDLYCHLFDPLNVLWCQRPSYYPVSRPELTVSTEKFLTERALFLCERVVRGTEVSQVFLLSLSVRRRSALFEGWATEKLNLGWTASVVLNRFVTGFRKLSHFNTCLYHWHTCTGYLKTENVPLFLHEFWSHGLFTEKWWRTKTSAHLATSHFSFYSVLIREQWMNSCLRFCSHDWKWDLIYNKLIIN